MAATKTAQRNYTHLHLIGAASRQVVEGVHGWKLGRKFYPKRSGSQHLTGSKYLDLKSGMVYSRRKANPKPKNPVGKVSKKQLGHAWATIKKYDKQHGIKPLKQRRNSTTINIRAKHVDLTRGTHNPSFRAEIRQLEREYQAQLNQLAKIAIKQAGMHPKTDAERAEYRALETVAKGIKAEASALRAKIKELTRNEEWEKEKQKQKNPKRGKRGKRNPDELMRAAREAYHEFHGREPHRVLDLWAPKGSGAPQAVTILGPLHRIFLEGKTPLQFGGRPDSPQLAEHPVTKDQLYVLGKNYRLTPSQGGVITRIEYVAKKDHLGDRVQTIYYHRAGEETGERPRLVVNEDGHALIKGGAYWIDSAGIHN